MRWCDVVGDFEKRGTGGLKGKSSWVLQFASALFIFTGVK